VKNYVKDEKLIEFLISSVGYHHWREGFEKILRNNIEVKKFIEWVLKNKDELEKNLKETLDNKINDGELRNLVDNIKLQTKELKEIENGSYFYNYAVPPYKYDFEPLRILLTQKFDEQKKWILISGFLQRFDHFASFCEMENEDLNLVEIKPAGEKEIKDRIVKKLAISQDKIWQIQKFQNVGCKNLILIAPTGYGKTEFAFLWSSNDKFIYTLPIRSAVNQIFERATEFFGNDKTGILHSDADIYLLEKEEINEKVKSYELAKNLSFPAIISTGDQFFPYALRFTGYEKIFSLFSYSNLIIDEVQAYNPKACAIIVKFIEWVYNLGGRFLLMTATLPKFVEEYLEKKIKKNDYEKINIYKEREDCFKNLIRHKIRVEFINNFKRDKNGKFDLGEEKIKQILNQAENGKRVLVILNTVSQAQDVYEKLIKLNRPNIKIFLLHSRFSLED
ncbi:MAG: CRISPR-associated helicase Cas3', partial [bacterium]|nr:CRISPR-associated helicase Cas3' [bacterium]MDW8163214.1 CRISPR-associated helicase Cas3' [Candidatus Omnitrophota bacterium]